MPLTHETPHMGFIICCAKKGTFCPKVKKHFVVVSCHLYFYLSYIIIVYFSWKTSLFLKKVNIPKKPNKTIELGSGILLQTFFSIL